MALPLHLEPVDYSRTGYHRPAAARLSLVGTTPAGRSARLDESVYRRRRIVAAAVLVVLVCVVMLLGRFISSSAELVLPRVPVSEQSIAPAVSVEQPGTLRGQIIVPGGTYVAQRGDTLWVVARALKPSGDVTPTMRRLIELNGGPSLEVGQVVVLPG
mgnify:CR=1 FL=1